MHQLSLGTQEGDGIGEVELTMRIVRTKASEARPELIQGEGVDAGIDFVDGALIVCERGILHDGGDAAIVTPNDPSVAGGALHEGRKNRGTRGALLMQACKLRKRFGAH